MGSGSAGAGIEGHGSAARMIARVKLAKRREAEFAVIRSLARDKARAARRTRDGLLSLAQAAPLLGCLDPRTARKRLVALGVPLVPLGRSVFVHRREVERAIQAAGRLAPRDAVGSSRGQGVVLAEGERLWERPPAAPGVHDGPQPRVR